MTKRRPSTTTIPVNGPALRALRMERGLEVAALAEQIEISRPYLTQLETGRRERVSPTVFKAIVDALQPGSRSDLIKTDELAESAA